MYLLSMRKIFLCSLVVSNVKHLKFGSVACYSSKLMAVSYTIVLTRVFPLPKMYTDHESTGIPCNALFPAFVIQDLKSFGVLLHTVEPFNLGLSESEEIYKFSP